MFAAPSLPDYEANGSYALASVITLYLTDLERMLRSKGLTFRQRKKQIFSRFLSNVKGAVLAMEELEDDLFASAQSGANYQALQEEDNLLARLMLIYMDRYAGKPEATRRLEEFMMEETSRGVIGEDELKRFRLR